MRSTLRTTAAAVGLLLVLAISAFAPLPAMAAPVPLTCTAPTKYTDGTSIAVGTPITFKFYRGTTAAAAASATTPVATATTCAATDNAGPGQWFYVATATVGGVESARTSAVTITVPNPTPEAPTNLQATVQVADTNAYKLRQSVDGFQLVAFGTVPVGTACDVSKVVNGYALVPRAAVTPRTRFEPLPLMAFAKCG